MRSKADETFVIVETLICPLQISNQNLFSYFKPLLYYGHYAQSVWPHDLTKGEDIALGVGGEAPAAIGKGGLGRSPQPPTDFYGFHIKNTRFSTLSDRKRAYRCPAVSAVTFIM